MDWFNARRLHERVLKTVLARFTPASVTASAIKEISQTTKSVEVEAPRSSRAYDPLAG
jgi:hypothetical protein